MSSATLFLIVLKLLSGGELPTWLEGFDPPHPGLVGECPSLEGFDPPHPGLVGECPSLEGFDPPHPGRHAGRPSSRR